MQQFCHDDNILSHHAKRRTISVTIYLLQSVLNHVGQLVSGLRTFKLNCRIETRRIIAGTRQGQLTFRSNANVTPTFHHHHLHSLSGTYLGRSAAATTRLESIRGHAVRHHGAMRDTSLYFSSEPLVSRARHSIPAIRV